MIAEKRPRFNPGKGNKAVVFRRGEKAKAAQFSRRKQGRSENDKIAPVLARDAL